MTDLKKVIADFPKTSAYAVLDDLVRVCGVGSVLRALSEIVAAQPLRAPDACPECGEEYSGACGKCAVGHERG